MQLSEKKHYIPLLIKQYDHTCGDKSKGNTENNVVSDGRICPFNFLLTLFGNK